MFKQVFMWITTVFLALFLTACSNGSSNSTTATTGAAISGSVSKGPINNATIDLYTFTANGSQGTFVVGGIVTDKYGEWTATLPTGSIGPFMVIATGGSYTDEYTGVTVQMGTASMRGVMDQYAISAPITPITDAALGSIQKMITDGYANDVKTALIKVKTNYTNSFGFDPLTTLPPAPEKLATASAQQKQYAVILGGISKLADDAYTALATGAVKPKHSDIVKQISADFAADGVIDGYGAGGALLNVKVGGINKPLNTVFTASNDLYAATKAYQASGIAPQGLAGVSNTVNPINFGKTLFDNTMPQVTAPTSITRIGGLGLTTIAASDPYIAAFLNAVSATDNIAVLGAITNDAPTSFPVGTTTVTFKAIDAAGNIGTATATITISAAATPTISMTSPQNAASFTMDGYGFVSIPIGVTITNFSLTNGAWHVKIDGVSTRSYNFTMSTTVSKQLTAGTHTLTVELTGPGKAYTPLPTQQSQTITITVVAATTGGGGAITDTTKPVVVAPASITVTAAQGASTVPASNATIVAFLGGAAAQDSVGVVGAITNDALMTFPVGVTTVTFTAKDAAGNIGTKTATITVKASTQVATSPFSITYLGAVNNATCDASKLIDPMYSTSNFTSTILGWTQYSADPGAVVEVFVDNPTAGLYKVRIRCTNLNLSWQATGTATVLNMVVDRPNKTFTFTNTPLAFQAAGALDPYGVTIPAAQLGITLNGSLQPIAVIDPTATMATGVKSWLPATSNLAVGTLPSSSTTTPAMGVTTATGYKSYVSGKATNFKKTLSTVRSTTDGVNWTTATFSILFELRSVLWDGAQYIATGVDFINGGKAVLATSNDGITWSTPIVMDITVWAGANNGTVTVLVGNGGYIASSVDGVTWTTRNAGKTRLKVTTKTLQHVIWTGTQFVATGTFGTIVTSTDGITWTVQNSGTNLDIHSVASLNGTIIASVSGTDPFRNASKTLLVSTDGITWTRLFPNAKGNMDVFATATEFFVNYNDPFVKHTVFSSTDGSTWMQESVGGATPAFNIQGQFNVTAGLFGFGYDKFKAYSSVYLRQ